MSLTRRERENRTKKLDISHEDFIRVWVKVYKAGGRIDDVAKELGTHRGHAYSRAEWLRKTGVQIPSFKLPVAITEEYIEDLNELVDDELGG